MRSLDHPFQACSATRRSSAGFTLIEVLISLLVFAFGVLGLVGLHASAIGFATDAQQRADATFLADQILARMLISDPATKASFNHKASGTTKCAPDGTASGNATVTAWLAEVARVLPNAAAEDQQIVVDSATNQVTVRLCWQSGNSEARELVVRNQVQWP
jgi:type IV pilus assembly protein PilV